MTTRKVEIVWTAQVGYTLRLYTVGENGDWGLRAERLYTNLPSAFKVAESFIYNGYTSDPGGN